MRVVVVGIEKVKERNPVMNNLARVITSRDLKASQNIAIDYLHTQGYRPAKTRMEERHQPRQMYNGE